MAEIDDKLRLNFIETLIDLTIALGTLETIPIKNRHIALGIYLTDQECKEIAKRTVYSWKKLRGWFLDKETFDLWRGKDG